MINDNDLTTIRDAINSRGLKVKFLASKIGVAPATLSSFLTGKRNLGNPALLSLLRELNLDAVKTKLGAS